MSSRALTLIGAVALAACAGSGSTNDEAADAGIAGADGASPGGDPSADGGIGSHYADAIVIPEAGEPAHIDVFIEPRRPLYTPGTEITVSAQVYDAFGELLDRPVEWHVDPVDAGAIGPDGTVTFAAEGPGFVEACVGDVCGRSGFWIDAGPPSLEIEAPERGTLIAGNPVFTVRGTATDTGPVRVFVNDRPAEVDPDGRFSAEVEAQFGFNRVVVAADDGVRRPPTTRIFEVMWAPGTFEVEPTGITLEAAAQLRVDQALLDGDGDVPRADPLGIVRLDDLSATLAAVIDRADPRQFADGFRVDQGETLQLTIADLRAGETHIDMAWTVDGVELYIRLVGLELDTAGEVSFSGETFELDGTIAADAAAVADLRIATADDGTPRVTVDQVAIVVEALHGDMDDDTVQALVEILDSVLGRAVTRYATDLLDAVVRDTLPGLFEGLIDGLTGALDVIPFRVQGDPLLPPIDMSVTFDLQAPALVPSDSLTLALDADVRSPEALTAPHPDPGVPTVGDDAEPPWPAGVHFITAIRLEVINVLLHELWRQHALIIDASSQVPAQFAALVNGVNIDARIAPIVAPAPAGRPYAVELQIGELDLFIHSPRTMAVDHFALSIRAGIDVGVLDGVFRFEMRDDPDIRIDLVEAGAGVPVLGGDALAPLLAQLVWPQVVNSVRLVLALPIDTIDVPPEGLRALAPSIDTLELVPTFADDPLVDTGWIALPAYLRAHLRLVPGQR